MVNPSTIDSPAAESSSTGTCVNFRTACHSFWKHTRTKYNAQTENGTHYERVRYALLCPPHHNVGTALYMFVFVLGLWGALVGITGASAMPGGHIFALLILVVASLAGGYAVTLIKLPPLLGMLLVGFMLRNVPGIDVAKDIYPSWSGILRNMALTVILLCAGLGLDPRALRKLSCVVLRLAFLPCLAECLAAAISSHLILGFPWPWAFMLGFVLGAVSPAVVVPSIMSLQEKGYGLDQGIPTLVIAASSVDDVLAITGFGVIIAIAFSSGKIIWTVFKGPVEALLGIVYGILAGILLWYLPSKDHSRFVILRCVLLLVAGLLSTFGSLAVDFKGAGALGCLTMAFVAAYKWRDQGWTDDDSPAVDFTNMLWYVFQPLLFGLIGAEVDIHTIQPQTVGLAIGVLCIGLFIRVIVSFLAVFGVGYTLKEKFFIPLAWLPKATVQAAIGSLALDVARRDRPDDLVMIQLGTQIVTLAVLSILITAPLGAAAIALTGPHLLRKSEPNENQDILLQVHGPGIMNDSDEQRPSDRPALSNNDVVMNDDSLFSDYRIDNDIDSYR